MTQESRTVKLPPIDQNAAVSNIRDSAASKIHLRQLDRIETHLVSLNRQIARFFHVGDDASLARREAARRRRRLQQQQERDHARSRDPEVYIRGGDQGSFALGDGEGDDDMLGNFVSHRHGGSDGFGDDDLMTGGAGMAGVVDSGQDPLSDEESEFVYPRTQDQIDAHTEAYLQQEQAKEDTEGDAASAADRGLRSALFKAVTSVDDTLAQAPGATGADALQSMHEKYSAEAAEVRKAREEAEFAAAAAAAAAEAQQQQLAIEEEDVEVDDLDTEEVRRLTQTHTFAVDLIETLLKHPKDGTKSRTFLLDDLSYATNWDESYAGQLGPLRAFLESYDHLYRVHENTRDSKVLVWLANKETSLEEERIDRFTAKRASKWLVFKERQKLRNRLEELVNTEEFLVQLIENVLKQNGVRCVKIPSLAFTLNWKDRYSTRYGDIKSFLRRHWKRFSYGELQGQHDMVWIKGTAVEAQQLEVDETMILDLKSLIRREYESQYRHQHMTKDHRYHARIAADDPNESRAILRQEMAARVRQEIAMYNEYFMHERLGLTDEEIAALDDEQEKRARVNNNASRATSSTRGLSRVEAALAEYDALKQSSTAKLLRNHSELAPPGANNNVPRRVVVEILGGPTHDVMDDGINGGEGGVFNLTQVNALFDEYAVRPAIFNPFHHRYRTVHAVKLPQDFTRIDEEPVSLMNQLTDEVVLAHVIGPTLPDMHRDKVAMREWAMSGDAGRLLRDLFWFVFCKEYRAGKCTREQEVMYTRAAKSFVLLFFRVHPRLKDRFFLRLANVFSQSIFTIFYHSFPGSRAGFNETFMESIVTCVYEWLTGGPPPLPAAQVIAGWNLNGLKRLPHTYSRRLAGSRASTNSRSQSQASGAPSAAGRAGGSTTPRGGGSRPVSRGGLAAVVATAAATSSSPDQLHQHQAAPPGTGGGGGEVARSASATAREERRSLLERATRDPSMISRGGQVGALAGTDAHGVSASGGRGSHRRQRGRRGGPGNPRADGPHPPAARVPGLDLDALKYGKDYGVASRTARERGVFDLTSNSKLVGHFLGDYERPITLQREQLVTHSARPMRSDIEGDRAGALLDEKDRAKTYREKADASVIRGSDVMQRVKQLRAERRQAKERIARDAARASEELANLRKINSDGIRALSNELLATLAAEEEQAELERERRWGEMMTTRQAKKASDFFAGTP